jgi:hypothetical protein
MSGAGQMATPLVAPAIARAVAELTGVRLRHTPFLPDRFGGTNVCRTSQNSLVAVKIGIRSGRPVERQAKF